VFSSSLFTEFVHLEEVDSTNRYALDTAKAGLVVRAATQTSGRGRRGRTWFSPRGENLYVTYTLSPVEPHYPIVSGVAVSEALAGFLPGVEVSLKWPNDVISCRKKLSGILCESTGGIIAVGVGVNVNQISWPAGLAHRSVSMRELAGREFDLDEVMRGVTEHIAHWVSRYREEGFEPVRKAFLSRGRLAGLDVCDDRGSPCVVCNLTDEGHLVIETTSGRRVLVTESLSIGWEEESKETPGFGGA